jgi:hypothetical protein
VVSLALDLLAASRNMRLKAVACDKLATLGVVVSLVEADPLWLLGGGDRAGDRNRGKRRLQEL